MRAKCLHLRAQDFGAGPVGWWLFLNGKLTGSKGPRLKKGLTNWAGPGQLTAES